MSLPLFSNNPLDSALEATTKKVTDRLDRWDHDALLNAAQADVIEELIDEATVECPRLRRDQAWMPPSSEVVQTFNNYGLAVERRERRVPQLTLVVPFEGEKCVFTLRPGRFAPNPPRAADLTDQELRLTLDGELADPLAARAFFDSQLDGIEKWLAWSREQIDAHNTQIRDTVPGLVSRRRLHLLATRDLQAEIGFPVRRRPDADTYSVPIKRRKLQPVRPPQGPSSASFRPEPVMAAADYEAALAVLRNSRNALERNPSTVEKFAEEQIRDVLLINLNAQFEGSAAGEVFNGDGKTDILIRVEDRNVFIGECKVWGGPGTMDEALEQIFKYLVWRDTKAAILLFIRNKDVTAVIKKAVEKIEAHPNYKRRGPAKSDERLDFIMHATGDPEREINLALLPFALRVKDDPTARSEATA
jgi:hypothetical protein